MRAPLWINRPLLAVPDLYRWGVEAGVRKMFPADQLHFTQATMRDDVEWGDLELDPEPLVIPAGPKPTQIFAYTIKALTFDHPTIRARHAFLSERFQSMDHRDAMRPHLSLYKGGRMPRSVYDGDLVFGPERAQRFDASNVRGIKHVRIADHV